MKNALGLISTVIIYLLFSGPLYAIGTTGVLSGKVMDKDSGKPVQSAFITARGTVKTFTTTTDAEGFFSITGVLAEKYEVVIERVGYQTLVVSNVLVTADATTHLQFQIPSQPVKVSGVTVLARRESHLTPNQTVTNYGYSDQEIRNIFPGPAGLNVRSLYKTLPGVQTGNDDYYGQIPHIRGGTGYDVGYGFDGVPLYDNITFSENNINSVGTNFTNVGTARTDVYVGTYPAQYGNFISGFINQIAKQGHGPIGGTLEYEYGSWLDSGNRLPSYNPATGNLAGYTGAPAYSPTNINFELGGQDRRFHYYFSQIVQDGGAAPYATGIDLKALINEQGSGFLNSAQKRDTVFNFNYDLDAANDLQLLFTTGIAKLNYAGFQELPCAPSTTGCTGTSNPNGAGFSESFNAFNITPLSDMHDEYSYDLEKLEWSHRFSSGSLLNVRVWQYSPNFFLNRFDLPSTLWEFERSSTRGLLAEHQNQITSDHLLNTGASFSYSKNYFLSSQTDLGFPAIGAHLNAAEQILYGFGSGQSQPGVADITQVPDTQTWSAWITDQWRPSSKWLIEGGLRWDKQTTFKITAPGIVTDVNGNPFMAAIFCGGQGQCVDPARFAPSQVTPRVGASYEWTDRLTMKASYGKFVTFSPSRRVESIRYSSASSTSSVYLPGFPANTPAAFQLLGSKPQLGENLDVSWEYKLDPDTYVKLTPYLKHMKDPLQIAIISGFPYTTNAGTIESKGIELMMKTQEWQGVSGWLSYTFSDTRGSSLPYQTDLMSSALDATRGFTQAQQLANAAQMVPTAYDQRHQWSLNLNIKRGNWEIAPNFTYGSGYPYGLGLANLQALAALMDSQSYLYGGPHTVQQSAAATPGFNPLGEAGFNGLRMPGWLLGNLAVTYHMSKDTSLTLNVFNLFNTNQILNVDNTVLSGIGYQELTNPNAFSCCYTSNDTTKNILPQYNPLKGQYAPASVPNLRQFYLTLRYNL